MKIMKKLFASIAALALGLSLAGCGSSSDSPAASDVSEAAAGSEAAVSDEPIVIRVGYFNSAQYQTQLAIAKEKGFFDEAFEGLNVEIEYNYFAGAGPAINEAFLAGELDVAHGIGDQPALSGILNNNETVIISRIVAINSGGGIVVRNDSGIESIADFKGKKIAIGLGQAGQKILDLYLADYGLTEDDVELVNLSNTDEIIAAFKSGEIDATLSSSYNYFENLVKDEGIATRIEDLSEHPNYAYLTMKRSFIENNPEVAEKFVEALYKANEWYNENVEEGNQLVANFIDSEIETVELANNGCTIQLAFDAADIENIRVTYDFLKANDILPSEVDDLSTLYDGSIINNIINNN